jgi:hypothetical protein
MSPTNVIFILLSVCCTGPRKISQISQEVTQFCCKCLGVENKIVMNFKTEAMKRSSFEVYETVAVLAVLYGTGCWTSKQ